MVSLIGSCERFHSPIVKFQIEILYKAVLNEPDPKRAIQMKKAVFVKAGLDPDLRPENMTHHHLAKVIELLTEYQKRNYEELHAYVDSSQFDIDKANYEQIEEMAARIKSANTMLRLVFKVIKSFSH